MAEDYRPMEGNGRATAGTPALDCLPPELLETICGFLDVGTLCTARLVCPEFRGAASRFLRSVELSVESLRSQPQTNLNNFQDLERVSVFGAKQDDLLMLAKSPIADAVTHVRAAEYLRPVPRLGKFHSPLQPLPSLMSLTVSHAPNPPFPFPETLRELILEGLVNDRTANLVARLTNLTCLRIDVSRIHAPFVGLTALTALRRLEICSQSPSIPFVGELTLLTHLRVNEMLDCLAVALHPFCWTSSLFRVSLTRLSRLVHLGVGPLRASLEAQVLASLGPITSLKSLHLHLSGRSPARSPARSAFETVCMTPFSQLTTLRLEIYPGSHLDATFLPRFNLERLQDLSLSYGVELDWDGVVALRQATGLTHLELWTMRGGSSMVTAELGVALSHMPRLRPLSLGTTFAFQATSCAKAIGLLTELTRLVLIGTGFTFKGNVEVCLALKKLHVLRMRNPCSVCAPPADRITPETVFAVGKLPELRKLEISGYFGIVGWHLTDEVRAQLNTERNDKGWPPLELDVATFTGDVNPNPLLWGRFGVLAHSM